MSKMDQLRDAIKKGPHDFAALRSATGLDTGILSVYLATLHKRGEITKTGTRKHFAYHYRAEGGAQEVAAPVAGEGTAA